MKQYDIGHMIDVAMGRVPCDLVLKNARYLNVFINEYAQGDIGVADGYFVGVGNYKGLKEVDLSGKTIVPSFIDSHIHLESSVVSPSEFAKAAAPKGTTAIVTDPHEITNVLGANGVKYMLAATQNLPIDVYFVLPSCIPASPFDETGGTFTEAEMEQFLSNERVVGLAEMMNFPGVLFKDEQVMQKLELFSKGHVDGHAPFLTGESLNAYIGAGITTDHECTLYDEAKEKISKGQWVMLREGTVCKNLDALAPLLNDCSERCVFACDDKHPSDIIFEGHIDHIVRRAISLGIKEQTVYKVASFNAAQCFGLARRGAIAPGYIADFVVLNNTATVDIDRVYKNGVLVDVSKVDTMCNSSIDSELQQKATNTIHLAHSAVPSDFVINKEKEYVIGLIKGQVITENLGFANGVSVENDILKLCVVERHKSTGHIGKSYVKGYGLKSGAVATSIAHDSHNIIVVGVTDEDIAFAVNQIEQMKGGIVVVNNGKVVSQLALPIAGLMSDKPIKEVERALEELKTSAYALGVSREIDPLMTPAFLSLPVIPHLKLTSLGLVDVDKFCFVD